MRRAATVEAVTSLPVSAYTPAVISRSCINAINTGTAYFQLKRNAMYTLIASSEAMIARTALFSTVLPKLGPTDVKLRLPARSPKRLSKM